MDERIEELAKNHKGLIVGAVYGVLGKTRLNSLEDVVQDAWISIGAALDTYKGNSTLTTWACSIAKNTACNWLRNKIITEKRDKKKIAEIKEIVPYAVSTRKTPTE